MRSKFTSTCALHARFEVKELGKMSEVEANACEAEVEERISDEDSEYDTDDSEFSDPEEYEDDITDEGKELQYTKKSIHLLFL